MKPEKMIELLKGMQSPVEDYAELVGAPAFTYGHKYVYPYPEDYAIEEAIKALEEVQQYREIGTVEECRKAVEKQKAKKPIWKHDIGIVHKDYADGHGETVEEKWADWVCPNCGWFVGEQYIPRRHNQRKSNYCSRCGQKINWDKNLEGMEDE